MTNRDHYTTVWKCLLGDPVLSLWFFWAHLEVQEFLFKSTASKSHLSNKLVSISCNPTTTTSSLSRWLFAPPSASLMIRQVLQARCWHQLCPGWQLGWLQWVGMSGHSPAVWVQREVLFTMLWKEETVWELLPCVSRSRCLNVLLNRCSKHQAKAKQVAISSLGL